MRIVFGFLFVLSVIFSAKAADYSDIYSKNEIGYDKFFSLQDDYKLILKGNDLYVSNIEGTSLRRITHTPKLEKPDATFSKDRGYILYSEYSDEDKSRAKLNYYRLRFDSDDNTKQLISAEEYNALGGK
jgi:hypothetical protein